MMTPDPIDPIMQGLFKKFEAELEKARQSKGPKHAESAATLCRLSREIRFILGAPEFASQQTREHVSALYEEAEECIDPTTSEEVSIFRSHIGERAGILRSSFADSDSVPIRRTRDKR